MAAVADVVPLSLAVFFRDMGHYGSVNGFAGSVVDRMMTVVVNHGMCFLVSSKGTP